ncbi:MAG: hypothetical protein IT530_16060 [Burkholderiales bacterium]|nr:hypothetical protein [Burkholderiales bacterium]
MRSARTTGGAAVSDLFERCFQEVVGIEGGYVNDPADSGGETKYGITIAVARAYGYTGPMRDLPLNTAQRIYRSRYWNLLRLGEIASESEAVARELFDSAVNCGQATAAIWLQRALNAFNDQGSLYADVVEDGLIGRMTIHALTQYLEARGERAELVLLRALNCQQGAHYLGLSFTRPKDERFEFGWFANRVMIPPEGR